jgi:hypothetical protein
MQLVAHEGLAKEGRTMSFHVQDGHDAPMSLNPVLCSAGPFLIDHYPASVSKMLAKTHEGITVKRKSSRKG